MEKLSEKLYSWASLLDDETLKQAQMSSRSPVIWPHLALMPDAHLGIGATVGSVVPTRGAIIPSTVGVDWGCGMHAARLSLKADELPDLTPYLRQLERSIPTGPGGSRSKPHPLAVEFMDACPIQLSDKLRETALYQCGSLGSGNHFLEIVQDENRDVWLFLHSGSRGVGNQLATGHIQRARQMQKDGRVKAEHPDLAWFTEGTPEFDAFIKEMLWGQDYALMNRRVMMTVALDQFRRFLAAAQGREYDPDGNPDVLELISCHHNYAHQEEHFGELLWITRKGAISARAGELGLIPGSMGARSYVVRGKGNPLALHSSPHGAGRLLSRGAAKRAISVATLAEQMGTRVWNKDKADKLTDEAPDAYKPIDQVMADAADLVEVVHTFTQLLNFKG